jgi:hypothetical protein
MLNRQHGERHLRCFSACNKPRTAFNQEYSTSRARTQIEGHVSQHQDVVGVSAGNETSSSRKPCRFLNIASTFSFTALQKSLPYPVCTFLQLPL